MAPKMPSPLPKPVEKPIEEKKDELNLVEIYDQPTGLRLRKFQYTSHHRFRCECDDKVGTDVDVNQLISSYQTSDNTLPDDFRSEFISREIDKLERE